MTYTEVLASLRAGKIFSVATTLRQGHGGTEEPVWTQERLLSQYRTQQEQWAHGLELLRFVTLHLLEAPWRCSALPGPQVQNLERGQQLLRAGLCDSVINSSLRSPGLGSEFCPV